MQDLEIKLLEIIKEYIGSNQETAQELLNDMLAEMQDYENYIVMDLICSK